MKKDRPVITTDPIFRGGGQVERFYESLKTLRLMQIVGVIVVLCLSAGVVYGIFSFPERSKTDGLEEDQQIIELDYGDLVRQVTTSGRLEFPNRDILNFGTAATVEAILVREGQTVTIGQELVKPDSVTLAGLSESVAQAQVDVLAVQDQLDELTNPTDLVLAQAQHKVAQAESAVREAQKALADVGSSTALDLAESYQKVAKAAADLESAEEALVDANEPYTADQIKTQEQTLASAISKVEDAQEELNGLGVDFSQSLASALLTQADAKAELETAKNDLESYETTNQLRLEKLQEEQILAQEAYDANMLLIAEYRQLETDGVIWFNIHTLAGLMHNALNENVDLKDTLDDANNALIPYDQLVTKKDKKQADLDKANIAVQDLGGGNLPPELDLQLDKINAAQASLDERLESGLVTTIAEAELVSLRLGLSALESGASLADVQLLERNLVQAWAEQGEAEESLDEMLAGADSVTVELKTRDVEVAKETHKLAKIDLEYVLEISKASSSPLGSNSLDESPTPDPVELRLAEMDLKVAELDLEEAIQESTDIHSPDAADVELLTAKLSAAEAAHTEAGNLLERAIIKAPYEGFISEILVETNDRLGANAPVIEVVDPRVLEMDGIVDEVDILLLSEGQPASITIDALTDTILDGFVSEITPVATVQQGVVTYPLRVQIEVPDNLELKDGLSAVADLVLEQQLDILLIPQGAIFGTFQDPVVKVETADGIIERPVVLGTSDDFWTEVIAGVVAGDRVVMKVSAAVDDPYGTFRQFRRGGPPGRGGGGPPPSRSR